MKILICQDKYVESFVSLTNCLHSVKDIQVASMTKDIDDASLISYKPDLIIHNSPFLVERLDKLKFLQLYIHYNVPMNCRQINLHEIGPVVDREILRNVQKENRYECDMVYIGSSKDLISKMLEYTDLSVRVFNPQPIVTPIYCGVVHRFSVPSVYNSAKVSLCHIYEDMSKLYEVILSHGNPVVFDPMNPNKFHSDVSAVLSGSQVVTVGDKILSASLNHNKLAHHLAELGFKALAQKIRNSK